MKVTLGDAKTRIAKHLNLCATDARTTEYINEAQRRLIESGKWKGTYGKFTICVTDGCIAWPRQIETIESVALNQNVGTVRNDWFEFVESGYGLLDNKDNVGHQLIDRGESPTQKDMSGAGKKIRVYAFVDGDAGKTINIQGYDSNNNWVRTQSGGSYIDGETVTLVNGFVDTTTVFKSITGVRKDVTQANVQLYELTDAPTAAVIDNVGGYTSGTTPLTVDPLPASLDNGTVLNFSGGASFMLTSSASKDDTTLTGAVGLAGSVADNETATATAPTLVDLATYEPDETLPSYRRSLIPSLGGAAGCESGTDKKVAVTVIAKLRFINAVNDTDVLMVSDLYAIKNMANAIKLEENRDFGAASEYRNLAFDSLQNQLANYMGDGAVPVLQMTNLNTHGGGGIESVI